MGFPTIHFTEQSMREGMQIESAAIEPADKVRLLHALSETGIERIVVGSFVSPRYPPQMARVDEVAAAFEPHDGVTYLGMAMNQRGRERLSVYDRWLALESMGIPMLICHMCDTFVRRNANQSQQDEIDRWPGIVERNRRRITRAPTRR